MRGCIFLDLVLRYLSEAGIFVDCLLEDLLIQIDLKVSVDSVHLIKVDLFIDFFRLHELHQLRKEGLVLHLLAHLSEASQVEGTLSSGV